MRTLIHIAPSLLAVNDINQLEAIVLQLDADGADLFHIDVMDGIFVPQTTCYLNPAITTQVKGLTQKKVDVHLMVQCPEDYIDRFIDAGADIITIHAEAVGDKIQLLRRIKQRNIRAGIALNPATVLDERIIAYCQEADMILLMTVVPGEGGQGYIDAVNNKIREARTLFPDKDIQVDGGVKSENAYVPVTAGANILVSGTGIIGQLYYKELMNKMRDALIIGSDHAGYDLKEAVKSWFAKQGKACIDVGTYTREFCDYPIYAKKVAGAIQRGDVQYGILICGTGNGMSIAANRYPLIRAVRVGTEYDAQMAKQHNNANILCLGGRCIGTDVAYAMIQKWLTTEFEQRHQQRLDMIEQ